MAESKLDRRQFLGGLVAAGVMGSITGMAGGSTGPAGSSATVGPGTPSRIPKWISASNIGDSILQDDGTAVKPITDKASDLGASNLHYRDVWISRNLTLDNGTSAVLQLGTGTTFAKLLWNAGLGISGAVQLTSAPPGNVELLRIDNATGDLIGDFNIKPAATALRDLGTSTLAWRDLYLRTKLRLGAGLSPSSILTWNSALGNSGATQLTNDSGTEIARFDNSSGAFIPDFDIRPNADATRNIGTSSLRFQDIYASRRVIIAAKNALVLDGQSMTQSSHTVSNADTDITTYSLGANSYTHVIVRVTGYVSFVTLSTNQSVNLKIKDGTTQVGNTMIVDGALSASASIPFMLEAAFVETSAVTIHFTEGAAAADANTTVFINSVIVLAES